MDEFQSKFLGETRLFIRDNIFIANVTSDTQMYRFCQQDFFGTLAFPAIPSLFGFDNGKWMSTNQEQMTEIFGWSSLVILIVVTAVVAYVIGYSLTKGCKVRQFLTVVLTIHHIHFLFG